MGMVLLLYCKAFSIVLWIEFFLGLPTNVNIPFTCLVYELYQVSILMSDIKPTNSSRAK